VCLKRLIFKNKMSSMVEMKEVMGTKVDATIFRKLRELHYLRSYSHRGKYYTIPETARFDAKGLWSCRDVHFSKQGSLLNAIAHHVDRSVAGCFEYEIESTTFARRTRTDTDNYNIIPICWQTCQQITGRHPEDTVRLRGRNGV